MVVIVNPYALERRRRGCGGSSSPRSRAASTSRPWTPTRRGTRPSSRARPRADGADVVVTLGGDGTVNEAANGLARHRRAALPAARRLAERLREAARHPGRPRRRRPSTCCGLADRWEPRQVDLGRVNGRLFTFSAGVGLDADVVERVDANPARKARWRELALRPGRPSRSSCATTSCARRGSIVEAPGHEPVEGVTALVQNGAALHVLPATRPIRVCRDVGRSTPARSPPRSCAAPAPLDLPTMGARLWSATRRHRPPARRGARAASADASAAPTAGRRRRSTARHSTGRRRAVRRLPARDRLPASGQRADQATHHRPSRCTGTRRRSERSWMHGGGSGSTPYGPGSRRVRRLEIRDRSGARGDAVGVEDRLDVAQPRDAVPSAACVSPTSTTKRFLTIGCLTVQRASTMLMPASAKVRERSSSRRVRSQASTWSSTRKEVSLSPSQ